MGKFQLRKPRIISKNFEEVGSHIDNVSKSLQDLVFTYSEQVDKALQKKHILMMLSSLVLILVIGSIISPRGKADIATFYPNTCLGGWINPKHAEKELETNSNSDQDQFTRKNSAILDKDAEADIYCGNFTGTFDSATKPTKIIVSLALTNKDILLDEVDEKVASTTDVLTEVGTSSSLLSASSTETVHGSEVSTSSSATSSEEINTASSTPVTEEASSAPSSATTTSEQSTPSVASVIIDTIVEGVSQTLLNVFGPPMSNQTDTVVVPPPTPTAETSGGESSPTPPSNVETAPSTPPQDPTTVEPSPTSFLNRVNELFVRSFLSVAFAEEVTVAPVETAPKEQTVESVTSTEVMPSESVSTTSVDIVVPSVTPENQVQDVVPTSQVSTSTETALATTTPTELSTTTEVLSASSSTTVTASSTSAEVDSTTASTSVLTEEKTDEDFLSVLYTFDGVTWTELGTLNEISMKYRTFEIPLNASSSWNDMSQLQIKIASTHREKGKPVVYLDGVKVEVLYEGKQTHEHPDFSRDTILSDETIDDMRIVTIINNDTNEEEVWYMYLDTTGTSTVSTASSTELTENATSSLTSATSTDGSATSTLLQSQHATSSATTASSTVVSQGATTTADSNQKIEIIPILPRNVWLKWKGKGEVLGETISARELVEVIKKADEATLEKEKKESRLPDFSIDLLKQIKGVFLNAIIVQVEKEQQEELWVYDLETNSKTKIENSSSTEPVTVAKDFPVGVKDSFIVWLSGDRKKIYAYNVLTKEFMEMSAPLYNSETGTRPRVSFPGLSYEVIIDADKFAFYQESTGEVFSDDNGVYTEIFRQKLDLDKVLDLETIGNLNLPVTEQEVKQE